MIDKVAGLDSGADDYLTKPFAIEELLARMRVAFKHCEDKMSKKILLQVQDLEIDTEKRLVTVGGDVVELTKKEYELLLYLVQNKNIVLTREQILNEVWGYSYIGETNVVDVYVRYLRAKIDEAFQKKFIHTIRGVGYYVKEE
ncbi:Response regulator ArlR [bioreactor metagenome]|uniref:Response regulator ArlR n=1 Tax=bioreactor metagenome TaxID=1076179 RepID=A0A645H0C0_9ZZZZ